MNIEMALKSRSYILDLDHMKLSFGIFFLLGCLIESLLHRLSGCTFIFVKNTHKSHKLNISSNFTFGNTSLVVSWSAIYCDHPRCPLPASGGEPGSRTVSPTPPPAPSCRPAGSLTVSGRPTYHQTNMLNRSAGGIVDVAAFAVFKAHGLWKDYGLKFILGWAVSIDIAVFNSSDEQLLDLGEQCEAVPVL